MEIKPRRRTGSAGCGVLNGLSGKTFITKRFLATIWMKWERKPSRIQSESFESNTIADTTLMR